MNSTIIRAHRSNTITKLANTFSVCKPNCMVGIKIDSKILTCTLEGSI